MEAINRCYFIRQLFVSDVKLLAADRKNHEQRTNDRYLAQIQKAKHFLAVLINQPSAVGPLKCLQLGVGEVRCQLDAVHCHLNDCFIISMIRFIEGRMQHFACKNFVIDRYHSVGLSISMSVLQMLTKINTMFAWCNDFFAPVKATQCTCNTTEAKWAI